MFHTQLKAMRKTPSRGQGEVEAQPLPQAVGQVQPPQQGGQQVQPPRQVQPPLRAPWAE